MDKQHRPVICISPLRPGTRRPSCAVQPPAGTSKHASNHMLLSLIKPVKNHVSPTSGNDRGANSRNDLVPGHLAVMHCSNLGTCAKQVMVNSVGLGAPQSYIFAGHLPLAQDAIAIVARLPCTVPAFVATHADPAASPTARHRLHDLDFASAGCSTVLVLRVSHAVVI